MLPDVEVEINDVEVSVVGGAVPDTENVTLFKRKRKQLLLPWLILKPSVFH